MDTTEQLIATCPVCESTNTSVALVRSAFWHDDRLVVVEHVPALVCRVCGEQFYDDGTVRVIDRMRANGFPPEDAVRELTVPVFMFGNLGESEIRTEASSELLALFDA